MSTGLLEQLDAHIRLKPSSSVSKGRRIQINSDYTAATTKQRAIQRSRCVVGIEY